MCSQRLQLVEQESELERDDGGNEADEILEQRLPLRAIISALLFVSPKPLSIAALAEAAKAKAEDVEGAVEELKGIFQEELHGFSLAEVGGCLQFRTSPRAARSIQRMIPPKSRKLSRAAAETLAVVAYKQPVQRAEIEAIRGVDALPTLKTLLDARLIRIVGRSDSAGHPALYGTTQTFLEKFGLNDLSELPSVRELQQLTADPGEAGEAEGDDQAEEALLAAGEPQELGSAEAA